MKLTTTGDADYTTGDTAHPGLTFPNMGKLRNPLSITITGIGATPPTLYLSEKGSMFALETLNVPETMTIENVTLHGLSVNWTTSNWTPPLDGIAGHIGYTNTNPNNTTPITSTPTDNTASLVWVGANNSFEMKANTTITGNRITSAGGGVHVNGGTFTMSGDSAKISENYGPWGGGVCVSSGEFIMSGDNAEISSNQGTNGGGGVRTHGTFTMSGANAKIIGNNTTDKGGSGVYVPIGTFTMSGANAEISGNHTDHANGGSGMFIDGTFIMESGMIVNNTAPTAASGIKNFRFNAGTAKWPVGTTAYIDAGTSFPVGATPATATPPATETAITSTDDNIWAVVVSTP
jgi:hypothetical protein